MKIDDNLSKIFDIELADTDKSLDVAKVEAVVAETSSLEKQREYVRSNIVELIEKGKAAMTDLTAIAVASEKSRDFEVLTGLIKTLVEVNTTLLDIEVAHKKPAPGVPSEPGSQTATTINNNSAVFVGTTSNLSEYIKTLNLDKNVIDVKGN